MASSLNSSSSLHYLPSNSTFQPQKTHPRICICFSKQPSNLSTNITSSSSSSSSSSASSSSSSCSMPLKLLQKSCAPLAFSLLLLWSNPAQAGFLSGITGIESVPGPELPKIEFLDRFNEENQKKYAENDERIKSSPLIQEYLERSKRNKDKNKQEILDKYCLRGAEWGVGDCSTEGMTAEEKESFIAMLKEKTGAK